MSVKQTESKITALYERLSRDDDNAGDKYSNLLNSRDWQLGCGECYKQGASYRR